MKKIFTNLLGKILGAMKNKEMREFLVKEIANFFLKVADEVMEQKKKTKNQNFYK